jgi:outer membrane lipoprotein carrier protein
MRLSAALLLTAAFLLCLPFTALAETPADVAAKLQAKYDKTLDLRADFTQVSVVKAMNMTREGSGELVIKKPGLLRYSYVKPEKQMILVKGEQFIMHVPSANQVVTRRMDRALLDKTPSTFLAGLGNITDSFDVSFMDRGPEDADGNYVLRLVPKGDGMGIKFITLTLDPGTYDILGFSFTEQSGNTNNVRLSDIKINKGVDGSEFVFEIPKGANVLSD